MHLSGALAILWILCVSRSEGKSPFPRQTPHIQYTTREEVVPQGSWASLDVPLNKPIPTPNYLGHNVVQPKCDVHCEFRTSEEEIPYADAVIFDALSVFGFGREYLVRAAALPEKPANQVWVNFGFEHQKMVAALNSEAYFKNIDVNMTFNQNDGIPITFTCDWGLKAGLEALKQPPKTKSKGVAFVASNCGNGGADKRTAYVDELMKYIEVDSYDWPPGMRKPIYDDHGQSMANKIKLFSDYKFVLAFENNNITDYVTEKLMCVLKAGSVPVYMGAPNIDEYVPGRRSIIKTSDFGGPKELAEYLLSLMHSYEYDDYFAWKEKPLSKSFTDKWSKCVFEGASCRLCKYLHERKEKEGSLKVGYAKRFALELGELAGPVVLPKHPLLNNLTNRYTLSLWVYPYTVKDSPRLIDRNSAGNINGFNMDLLYDSRYDRTYLRLCAAWDCFMGTRPIVARTWHHLTVTFDATSHTTVKLYVNGKLDFSFPTSGTPTQVLDSNIIFGATSIPFGTQRLNGLIDNVSIWSKPLTQEEIKYLQFHHLFGDEEDLIAYYMFNHPQDTKSNSGTDEVARIVKDESVNNIHATVKGEVVYKPSSLKPLHASPFI